MAKSSFASKPSPAGAKPLTQPKAPAKAAPAAPAKAQPAAKAAPAKAVTTPKAPPGIRTNVDALPAPRQAAPSARQPSTSRHPAANRTPAVEVEVQEDVEQSAHADTQLALAPNAQVGLMNVPIGQSAGVMSQSDFDMPKLALVQGIGPLFEAGFPSGTLVLNGMAVIWGEDCEPIDITVMRYVKQFVENLPYGSEEFPRIYATPEAAEADGLSSQWGPNNEKPDIMPQLLCMAMVKDPGNLDDESRAEFNIEYGDDLYALVNWRISGAAYAPCVRAITNAQRTRLRDGLHTGSFALTAKKITSTKGKATFSYYVPVLQPGVAHPQEFIDFLVSNG